MHWGERGNGVCLMTLPIHAQQGIHRPHRVIGCRAFYRRLHARPERATKWSRRRSDGTSGNCEKKLSCFYSVSGVEHEIHESSIWKYLTYHTIPFLLHRGRRERQVDDRKTDADHPRHRIFKGRQNIFHSPYFRQHRQGMVWYGVVWYGMMLTPSKNMTVILEACEEWNYSLLPANAVSQPSHAIPCHIVIPHHRAMLRKCGGMIEVCMLYSGTNTCSR